MVSWEENLLGDLCGRYWGVKNMGVEKSIEREGEPF
jgi:hypothetical protein